MWDYCYDHCRYLITCVIYPLVIVSLIELIIIESSMKQSDLNQINYLKLAFFPLMKYVLCTLIIIHVMTDYARKSNKLFI